MRRLVTLGAVLLLVACAVSAWLLVANPVRIHDDLSGPKDVERLPWPDMRLDVNEATAEELTLLPGIGPAYAEAIVRFRNERGRIESVEQLLEVPGIGEARLEAIAPHVVVE